METIQISLAAARVNAGLTQRDVAAAMGVSQSTVINWEKYVTEPTVGQSRKLCELYEMPIDAIRWA